MLNSSTKSEFTLFSWLLLVLICSASLSSQRRGEPSGKRGEAQQVLADRRAPLETKSQGGLRTEVGSAFGAKLDELLGPEEQWEWESAVVTAQDPDDRSWWVRWEDLPSFPAFQLNESRPSESLEQSFELLLKLLPAKRIGRIRVFGQAVAGEAENYELAAKRAEWAVRRLEQAIPGVEVEVQIVPRALSRNLQLRVEFRP